MIFYNIPYDSGKNLADAYNRFMQLLPDGSDFACFIDGDACFTVPHFGHQLEAVVAENPQCRLFYATCNRIGCTWQKACDAPSGNDVAVHRAFGKQLAEKYGGQIRDVSGEAPGSGFLILVRRDVWEAVGGFRGRGMLGVDWRFFKAVADTGEPICQMTGVYLYHWYRGGTGDISHLT